MSCYFETVLELPRKQSHFYAAIPTLAMGHRDAAGRLALRPAEARPGNPGEPEDRTHMAGMVVGAV